MMTLQEILNALEGLKDSINDPGKVAIEGIKVSVRQLVDELTAPPPVVVHKPLTPQMQENLKSKPARIVPVKKSTKRKK